MKLYKAAKLTPIEVPAVPGCENLEEQNVQEEVKASTEAIMNDNPQQQQQKPQPPFQFHVCEKEGKPGEREFYFYLNEPSFFSEVMQLTNLIATCTEKDSIFISLGGIVSMNAANLLVSVLNQCKAFITMDAPAIYNIYAGSVLTAADMIRVSKYMTAVYDYPQMSAGGGHRDAEEAIKFNKFNFQVTVNLLVNAGFLRQEEADKLCGQNLVTVSGKELCERYKMFNIRKAEERNEIITPANPEHQVKA